jgi:hypothetical protein
MVEEDQPERDAPEQIEPQIAFGGYGRHERLFFPAALRP